MIYIVGPREGFRELAVKPPEKRAYFNALLESRRGQLDVLWLRIAESLDFSIEERNRADSFMQMLPGTGYLLFDDTGSHFSDLIAKLKRLHRLPWLKVWIDSKIPPQLIFTTQAAAGPAMPWHLNAINKPPRLDGTGVTIGVIDYAYDPTVEDLKAPFKAKFLEYHTVSKTLALSTAPIDNSSSHHGSMVMGYLAGTISGVAPGASVTMASLPFSSQASDNETPIIKALEYLFTMPNGNPDRSLGCDIITTSLTTAEWAIYDKAGLIEATLKTGFETWETLLVAAIGNGGQDHWQCPGASQYVVGVGSVDKNGAVTYFSAYGDTGGGVLKPDIVAPGLNLEWPEPGGVTATIGWGTSFSAPMVAGAAALILENDPTLRTDVLGAGLALRKALYGFAKNPSNTTGNGRLDLTGL